VVVIHYKEVLYQVYAPLPLPLKTFWDINTKQQEHYKTMLTIYLLFQHWQKIHTN